jgi:hypothetical protein
VGPLGILVLVGPNWSGKSLALAELERFAGPAQVPASGMVVIKDASFRAPASDSEARDGLRGATARSSSEHPTPSGGVTLALVGAKGVYRKLGLEASWIAGLTQPESNPTSLRNAFQLFTTRVDIDTRLKIVSAGGFTEKGDDGEGIVYPFYGGTELGRELRRRIYASFGYSTVVDGKRGLKLRLVRAPPVGFPPSDAAPEELYEFRRKFVDIDNAGDGVRAFIGLQLALLAAPSATLLIDEPEMFLHPPQAENLGRDLAQTTNLRGTTLVLATHSADLLVGLLSVRGSVDIVRLTYGAAGATARAISRADLERLYTTPLVRPTDVLQALFHRSAVLVEGNTDRAVYEEVNRRLLAENAGILDGRLVEAHGKGETPLIAQPLQAAGVPCAMIFDLDILTPESDKTWADSLRVKEVPTAVVSELSETRAAVWSSFQGRGGGAEVSRIIKSHGLRALPASVVPVGERLLSRAAEFGVFLVHVGELEGWLRGLNINGSGRPWASQVVRRLREPAKSPEHVPRSPDDIWGFIAGVAAYLNSQS